MARLALLAVLGLLLGGAAWATAERAAEEGAEQEPPSGRWLAERVLAEPGRDVFRDLSATDLAADWSDEDGGREEGAEEAEDELRLGPLLGALLGGVRWQQDLHVRLVGWTDPDTTRRLRAQTGAAPLAARAPFAQPLRPARAAPVPLAVPGGVALSYSEAPAALAAQLHAARNAALAAVPFRRAELPVHLVEGPLGTDFAALAANRSAGSPFVLYLLNMSLSDAPYLYVERDPGRAAQAACGSSHWAAAGAGQRWAWLDLAAGPLEYGPAVAGAGFVSAHQVPFMAHYLLPGAAGLLDARRLLLDASAFVVRTAEQLVAPPLHAVPPAADWDVLAVRVVVLRGLGKRDERSLLDAARLREQLAAQVPLRRGQRVELTERALALGDCPECAAAVAQGMRLHTSSYHSGAARELRLSVQPYLDSLALHRALQPALPRLLASDAGGAAGPPRRVLPVVVLDVAGPEVLLLDRFHQALPFADMVLAVQAEAPKVALDFRCNAEALWIDARSATRPVLAAVLAAAWGVFPADRTVRAAHSASEEAYEWAAGRAASGPFSASTALTGAAADLAARNAVLLAANRTAAALGELAPHFADYGRDFFEVAAGPQRLELLQRCRLLHWKWRRAADALRRHEQDAALAFVQSAGLDAARMHHLVHAAGRSVRSALQCSARAARALAWEHVAVLASALAVLAAAAFFAVDRLVLPLVRARGLTRRRYRPAGEHSRPQD